MALTCPERDSRFTMKTLKDLLVSLDKVTVGLAGPCVSTSLTSVRHSVLFLEKKVLYIVVDSMAKALSLDRDFVKCSLLSVWCVCLGQ